MRALAGALGLSAFVTLFWWLRIVAPARMRIPGTGDLRTYFYPTYQALFDRVAQGDLPLWNPYQLCGLPWLGGPAGGLFYPPHVLYVVLPTHAALATLGLLHLVLIALSTLVLVRRAGFGMAAGVLAAILFTLRGTILDWLRWPPLLESVAWLPLGCVAILELARGGGARAAGLLALCTVSSWLAGGPQATAYVLYAWVTFVPAALVGARAAARRCLITAALAAAAIGLGTLGAAIQLIPGTEMAGQGTRATGQLETALMLPFGDSGPALLERVWLGDPRLFGVLALALAPAVLADPRHRALAAWAVAAGVVAFLVALGPMTPIFGTVITLPLLGWFRSPNRLIVLVQFCLALLAGIALDTLVARGTAASSRAVKLARWLPSAAALAMAAHLLHSGALLPAIMAVAVAGVLCGPWRVVPAVIAGGLVTLAIVEVTLAPPNRALLPYTREDAADYRPFTGVYARLREEQASGRVWFVHPRLYGMDLVPKLASYHRVRTLDDYESVTLRRQAEYFTFLTEGGTRPLNPIRIFAGRVTPPPSGTPLAALATRRRLADLAAVRLVVVPAAMLGSPDVQAFLSTAKLRPLPSPHARLALFENPHALPRAFVVYRTETAPDPASLLARLSDPAFDPLEVSYVEGAPLPPAADASLRGRPAVVVRDEEELVEVEATLAAPGLLVLADAWYPGWRATVDGAPAAIVPTNHLYRGVPVPAGGHRVRFEYRPASVAVGAAASLAAGLAIAWLLTRAP
jgi:hypothetical protein